DPIARSGLRETVRQRLAQLRVNLWRNSARLTTGITMPGSVQRQDIAAEILQPARSREAFALLMYINQFSDKTLGQYEAGDRVLVFLLRRLISLRPVGLRCI